MATPDKGSIYESHSSIQSIELPYVQSKQGHASAFSAIVNLSNCAVGAGVLSIPYATENMGIYPTILFFIMFATFACYSLSILPKCAEAANVTSYEEVVHVGFGFVALKIFQIILILYGSGVAIGYIVIVGDLVPPVLAAWFGYSTNEEWFISDWFVQTMCTIFILIPLGCLKKLDSLKYTSVLALLSVLYFVILLIILSIQEMITRRDEGDNYIRNNIVNFGSGFDIFLGVPLVAFSFGGHIQSISIYSELKSQTPRTWEIVSGCSVLIMTTMYVIVSFFGYFGFLPGIEGNILEQLLKEYPNDPYVQVASLAMSLLVTLSYALFSWAVRFSLHRLLFPKESLIEAEQALLIAKGDATILQANHSKLKKNIIYYSETVIIILITLLFAIFLQSLEIVLGLVGAVGAVLTKYVIPPICFIKMYPRYYEKYHGTKKKMPIGFLLFALLCIITCGIAGIISTGSVLYDGWEAFQNKDD